MKIKYSGHLTKETTEKIRLALIKRKKLKVNYE